MVYDKEKMIMNTKEALRINARPWNFTPKELKEAQALILKHAATCERSGGVLPICPLCGEHQPQAMPDAATTTEKLPAVTEAIRKRDALRLAGVGGAWIDPFGPQTTKKAA